MPILARPQQPTEGPYLAHSQEGPLTTRPPKLAVVKEFNRAFVAGVITDEGCTRLLSDIVSRRAQRERDGAEVKFQEPS